MKKKQHISPSQINMYCRCPKQWEFRYIKKIVSPPGIALIKGTSIHRGADHNFRQKIDSHKDLEHSEIIDKSVTTLEEVIKHEGVSLSEEEESTGKRKVIGEAKDTVVTMAETLAKEVCPVYQPIEVEKRVTIELPKSTHDFLGVIDLMTVDGTMDIKTSGKAWSQAKLDKDVQMKFYGLMRKAIDGKNLPVNVENITGKGKRVFLTATFNQDDYQRLLNRINAVLDGINKGSFPPCHQDNFLCSEKFCGFYRLCDSHS